MLLEITPQDVIMSRLTCNLQRYFFFPLRMTCFFGFVLFCSFLLFLGLILVTSRSTSECGMEKRTMYACGSFHYSICFLSTFILVFFFLHLPYFVISSTIFSPVFLYGKASFFCVFAFTLYAFSDTENSVIALEFRDRTGFCLGRFGWSRRRILKKGT